MAEEILLKNCRTLVFDCDGVILNSNRIKTDAFFKVAQRFGNDAADQLVSFHVSNGGISRYRKFEYLLTDILHRPTNTEIIANLAHEYGELVYNELLHCTVASRLAELRAATAEKDWMIVSGGDETELRKVFVERGLAPMFNLGIYGSPNTKDEILYRETVAGRMEFPAVFLGDSRYDHEAAKRAGLSFVFIHGWTEFSGWREYCRTNFITTIENAAELLNT